MAMSDKDISFLSTQIHLVISINETKKQKKVLETLTESVKRAELVEYTLLINQDHLLTCIKQLLLVLDSKIIEQSKLLDDSFKNRSEDFSSEEFSELYNSSDVKISLLDDELYPKLDLVSDRELGLLFRTFLSREFRDDENIITVPLSEEIVKSDYDPLIKKASEIFGIPENKVTAHQRNLMLPVVK